MEGFLIVVYIIMLVWGILNIILFFKIWGMTNDVNDIKEFLIKNKLSLNNTSISYQDNSKSNERPNSNQPIEGANSQTKAEKDDSLKIGDKVRHESLNRDKIMTVGSINADGSCLCMDEYGNSYGTYSADKLTKI